MIFINGCLESTLILLATLTIAKYVFLEKGLSQRGTIRLVLIMFLAIVVGNLAGFQDAVIVLIVLAVMLWIYLGRDTHKLIGIFLVFPILGIVDGLFLPFAVIPQKIFNIEPWVYEYFKLPVYSILLITIVVFSFRLETNNLKRKDKFDEVLGSNIDIESHNRSLSKMELFFLCFIGLFELLFSMILETGIGYYANGAISIENIIKGAIVLISMGTFVMALIGIILVMSGNKRTYYHDKISDMQFNIIVMMAEIVENRDADTGGHIHRTAKYVEIITRQLKKDSPYQNSIDDQFYNDIKVAAPLHDIGKIHVSDEILNFPGRLSEEQFAIMKTHAEEGRKLLISTKEHIGDFSYLTMATDMAGYHHEWWDGGPKGYPDHKKGEEIPLCARIMAVADVFDALTAERIYKKAMPCEKAISIILEEKGTHFDPIVVDAFMTAIEEIKTALADFERK